MSLFLNETDVRQLLTMPLAIEAVEEAIGGQADLSSAKFIEALAELDGETGAQMGASANRLKRHAMIAIGIINCSLSRSIALDYADRLDALSAETLDPYAQSCSLRVRYQASSSCAMRSTPPKPASTAPVATWMPPRGRSRK